MNISLCQTSSYQTNSNFLLSRDVLRAVHSEPRILRITIAIADNFTISALLKVQDRCQIIGSLFLKIQNTEYKFRMHSVASYFDFYLYFGPQFKTEGTYKIRFVRPCACVLNGLSQKLFSKLGVKLG